MLLLLIYTYLSFYKKLQKETCDTDQRLTDIFEKCKKRMGVKRNLSLAVSGTVNTPSLFGVINPKIILPRKLQNLVIRKLSMFYFMNWHIINAKIHW